MATAKKKAPRKKSPAKKTVAKKQSHAERVRALAKGDKMFDILSLADEDDVLSTVSQFISTGSLALDKLLGTGGFPVGRISTITGDPHTGKSTLLDHLMAAVQRMGGTAYLIDAEVARDRQYTSRIGVDTKELVLIQLAEPTIDDTWSVIGKVIDEKEPDDLTPTLIGVDSLAGMPTKDALERDAGMQKPGDAAKAIHHGFRSLISRIAKKQIALVLINQTYAKIGPFASKVAYGGQGMGFYPSLWLHLSGYYGKGQSQKLKDSSGIVEGQLIEAEIRKHRLNGNMGAKGPFAIVHGKGIDNAWTLYNAFKDAGFIGVGGAFSTMVPPGYSEPLKWRGGWRGLGELLNEDSDLFNALVAAYVDPAIMPKV